MDILTVNMNYFLRGDKRIKQIGEEIEFIYPTGSLRKGVIECRNWCFERLTGYVVKDKDGKAYHVNPRTLNSGYAV